MSKVTPFPKAPSFECLTVSQADVVDIQELLSEVLPSCPACAGIGQFAHKHPVYGWISWAPCPCGGTDEDRIDLNDFGGAA
jgi:hypothetical protein